MAQVPDIHVTFTANTESVQEALQHLTLTLELANEVQLLRKLRNAVRCSIQGMPDHPWIPGATIGPVVDALLELEKLANPPVMMGLTPAHIIPDEIDGPISAYSTEPPDMCSGCGEPIDPVKDDPHFPHAPGCAYRASAESECDSACDYVVHPGCCWECVPRDNEG